MKVLPFKIPKPQNLGVIYQEDKELFFYDKLHQHEEIQLSYIVKGKGTLIIGDTINSYKSGDILLIGSNLSHVFKSDATSIEPSLMISLFFTEHSFGKDFFSLEDFKELSPFFKKSVYGFKIVSHQQKIHASFLNLQKGSNLERFIGLFYILRLMHKAKKQQLSSFIYAKKYSDNEGKRMRDVMDFTIHHFEENINLNEISNIANMSPNAFCRYFKQRTNKSYFTFLNEFRIEKACKILTTNKEISIYEIAFQCGFNNLSNFNRMFKKIKKTSPSKYRNN